MSQHIIFCYLWHRRTVNAQASLPIDVFSPESSLLACTSYGYAYRLRQKFRAVVLLSYQSRVTRVIFCLQLLNKTLTCALHLSQHDSIDHLCINHILRIGLIHKWYIDYKTPLRLNKTWHHCHSLLVGQYCVVAQTCLNKMRLAPKYRGLVKNAEHQNIVGLLKKCWAPKYRGLAKKAEFVKIAQQDNDGSALFASAINATTA